MTYYIIVTVVVILFDVIYKKNIKNKRDRAFYIVSILLALGLAVFYYSDTFRIGLAEYFVAIFEKGG